MQYGLFEQILTILILSVIVISIFRRLSLPSILGYLAVGIIIAIIDRYAFRDIEAYNILAKYGVVFLLFTIGLEFSITKLIALKRIVFLLGGVQVLVCTVIFWLIAVLFGMSISNGFIVGAMLSLSSTALISKVLSEAGEVQTHTGRMTIGVLIFQDIMVVPLLIITSILANNTETHLFRHLSAELIIGILTFIIIYFIGRLLLTPFFKEVARARSNELFVLAAFLTALGAAYFSDAMGMSKELGAFLAGVILAGTPYHKQVASDIRPFRDVLLGLFFVGIGMSLNISALPQTGLWIVLVGFLIVGIKFAIIPLLAMMLRLADKQQAYRTGLLLAQGGEFGFVLIAVATHFKLIKDFHGQVIIGGVIFSMIVSLILIQLQKPLSSYVKQRQKAFKAPSSPKGSTVSSHIILCGFGYTGQQIAQILKTSNLAYNAIDTDASCVSQASMAGEPVYYGDATNRDILLSLGLKQAQAIVVCFNNETAAKDIHQIVAEETQRTPLIIRVKMKSHKAFPSSSTVSIIDEGIEMGFLLGQQLLSQIGFKKEKILKITDQVKQNINYNFFRGEVALLENEDLDKPQIYAFRLNPNTIAHQKNLNELDIDTSKIKLKSLRRNKESIKPFDHQTPLQAGDTLVVTGMLDDIESFEETLNQAAKDPS